MRKPDHEKNVGTLTEFSGEGGGGLGGGGLGWCVTFLGKTVKSSRERRGQVFAKGIKQDLEIARYKRKRAVRARKTLTTKKEKSSRNKKKVFGKKKNHLNGVFFREVRVNRGRLAK